MDGTDRTGVQRTVFDITGQRHAMQSHAASWQLLQHPVQAHRVFVPGTSVFNVAHSGVKFYAPSGLCKAHGYRSVQNKYTGWSLWLPHAVPQGLEVDHVSCAQLRDAALPEGLELVFDRRYTTVSGATIDFDHYLICPSAEMSSAALQDLGDAVLHDACVLAGAASAASDHRPDDTRSPPAFFQLELVEGAVGPAAAAEHALRSCMNDISQPASHRIDAAVLSAWIGTNDPSMEDLAHDAPWAASFVLWVLRRYPVSTSAPPLLREHYPIALRTIERCLLDDGDVHTEDKPSDMSALSAHLSRATLSAASILGPIGSTRGGQASAAGQAGQATRATAGPSPEHHSLASAQSPTLLLRSWQQLPADCWTAVRLVLYHVENATVSDFDGDMQSICAAAIASQWSRPVDAVHLIPLAYSSVCLAVIIDDNFTTFGEEAPALDELPDVPPTLRLPLRTGVVDTHVAWEPPVGLDAVAVPAVPAWTDLRVAGARRASAEARPVVLPESSTSAVLRLHAIQCRGETKGNERCKNRTKSHFGYCWRHDYQRRESGASLPLPAAEAPVATV